MANGRAAAAAVAARKPVWEYVGYFAIDNDDDDDDDWNDRRQQRK